MTSMILRVVNSPLYSRGQHISTLPAAIGLLGINIIRSLAMVAFGRSVFAKNKNKLIRTHIWQHSLLTAIVSQAICLELGGAHVQEEAFVAGLIHDIGKILLCSHNMADYVAVLNHALDNKCAVAEAERHIYGIDHYQVGGIAVKEWNLPEQFTVYIGTDLNIPPVTAQLDPVQMSIRAANSLVKGAGIGGSLAEPEATKKALSGFGLKDELIGHLMDDKFIQDRMANELYRICA